MVCIDNSEWMGKVPSRFQAQADAVNLICGAKTQRGNEGYKYPFLLDFPNNVGFKHSTPTTLDIVNFGDDDEGKTEKLEAVFLATMANWYNFVDFAPHPCGCKKAYPPRVVGRWWI
ncbi:hypothetical protein GQ457_05G012280 [Hibiscus cannabinus]